MDSMRSAASGRRGHSPAKAQHPQGDALPEQLLDSFRAAALSVTKLYKTSAAVEAKARQDGYQDCLDDLLAFLDRENMGLDDGEGWKIRRWATERLDGREAPAPESDDEVEKTDLASSTELTRVSSAAQMAAAPTTTMTTTTTTTAAAATTATAAAPTRVGSVPPRTESAPPATALPMAEDSPLLVPTQDNFTFQSSYPYPQLEMLDLSDSRSHDGAPNHSPSSTPSSRTARARLAGRSSSSRSNHLGRGAGTKRKLNYAELFDIGSLGNSKDPFGGSGKRNRHA